MFTETLSWAPVGKGKAQEEGRREYTRGWGAFKGAPLPGSVPAALPAPDRNGQDFGTCSEHEISPRVSSSAMMQTCLPSHASTTSVPLPRVRTHSEGRMCSDPESKAGRRPLRLTLCKAHVYKLPEQSLREPSEYIGILSSKIFKAQSKS